jgi:hypothetical protein
VKGRAVWLVWLGDGEYPKEKNGEVTAVQTGVLPGGGNDGSVICQYWTAGPLGCCHIRSGYSARV